MAVKTTSIRTSITASLKLDVQLAKINKIRIAKKKYPLSKSECLAIAIINFEPKHGIEA